MPEPVQLRYAMPTLPMLHHLSTEFEVLFPFFHSTLSSCFIHLHKATENLCRRPKRIIFIFGVPKFKYLKCFSKELGTCSAKSKHLFLVLRHSNIGFLPCKEILMSTSKWNKVSFALLIVYAFGPTKFSQKP